ncbi:hypothetical protein NOL51_03255 [Vibrio parahaemolyticus]|uniref:hypothetical protein n=1 Tax=Vibrio parahaemolyticus TaxID=670 RepID=UPI00226AEA81|nr:hypothetical protein [Vibrio parahaemolyticus]EHK0752608.1 hypothetical protein [Vibrio parahaemolyticus]MCX8932099.1 hypothetical protein [Vibrio parahaemolyticus]
MQALSVSAALTLLTSVVSSIGTIATVAIAARALSSWKAQLKATDRRELSHSMFEVLVHFIQLNREFRLKCESWLYNEKMDNERAKIQTEIFDTMCQLERHLLKLYLLSDIDEAQFCKFQDDLRSLVNMADHIRFEIISFHYMDEEDKTVEARVETMIKTCRPHIELLTSFQKELTVLLKINFQ